jgi:hypothetical protein
MKLPTWKLKALTADNLNIPKEIHKKNKYGEKLDSLTFRWMGEEMMIMVTVMFVMEITMKGMIECV